MNVVRLESCSMSSESVSPSIAQLTPSNSDAPRQIALHWIAPALVATLLTGCGAENDREPAQPAQQTQTESFPLATTPPTVATPTETSISTVTTGVVIEPSSSTSVETSTLTPAADINPAVQDAASAITTAKAEATTPIATTPVAVAAVPAILPAEKPAAIEMAADKPAREKPAAKKRDSLKQSEKPKASSDLVIASAKVRPNTNATPEELAETVAAVTASLESLPIAVTRPPRPAKEEVAAKPASEKLLALTSDPASVATLPEISGPGPYLPYTGQLHLIDAGDPGYKSVPLARGDVKGYQEILTFALDTTLKHVISVQPSFLIFVEDDRLRKVDVRAGSSLTKTQVSSATFSDVCALGSDFEGLDVVGIDPTDPGKDKIFWETAGSDRNCETLEDNHIYMTTLNTPENVDAIDVSDRISMIGNAEALLDPNNPAAGATEIIAVNGDDLVAYDADLNNPRLIAKATRSLELNVTHGKMFNLSADGTFVSKDGSLYWYARGSGILSEALYTASGGKFDDLVCDTTNCYFFGRERSGKGSLYRVPADGSTPAGKFASRVGQFGGDLSGPQLTQNYVYYVNTKSGVDMMYRVPKKGGKPALVDAGVNIHYLVGPRNVYYEKLDFNSQTSTAVVAAEDGSPIVFYTGSMWAGYRVDVVSGNAEYAPTLLLTDITDPSNIGAATVKTFDATRNALGTTLGKLPNDAQGFYSLSFGRSPVVTGSAWINDPDAPKRVQTDVFAMNLSKPDSLRRITHTSMLDEEPIDW